MSELDPVRLDPERLDPGRLDPSALPSRQFRNAIIFLVANVVFLAGSFAYLKINPILLFTEFHYVIDLMFEMMPPAFELYFAKWDLWVSVGETFAMAFLGTFFGALIAFFLSLIAARNISPWPALSRVFRVVLGAQRAAPDFAIMMVIVVAVGFGPFAGTMALVIGSTGMFGKLFADALESIDESQLEALRALGAGHLHVIRYGALPQVIPSFIAHTLYLFEINVGGAVALGVFGGGGLGFDLHIANSTLAYRDMLAYILLIVAMMVLTEKVSDFARRMIFRNSGTLK